MPAPKSPSAPPPPIPLDQRNHQIDVAMPSICDSLNEVIKLAEVRLRKLNPIESVWHRYAAEEDQADVSRTNHYVGFGKYEGKWRLLYSWLDEPTGATEEIPLTDCPIQARVDAAAHIPALNELIVASKEEFVLKLNETISAVKSFIQNS